MQHYPKQDPTSFRLITAEQIGERWQIPTSTVYEYARRKHDPCPSRKIGKHRRFIAAEVDEWVDRQFGEAA